MAQIYLRWVWVCVRTIQFLTSAISLKDSAQEMCLLTIYIGVSVFSFPSDSQGREAIRFEHILNFYQHKGHIDCCTPCQGGLIRRRQVACAVKFPGLIKFWYKRLDSGGIRQKPTHSLHSLSILIYYLVEETTHFLKWTAWFASFQLHLWWQRLKATPWWHNQTLLVRTKISLLPELFRPVLFKLLWIQLFFFYNISFLRQILFYCRIHVSHRLHSWYGAPNADLQRRVLSPDGDQQFLRQLLPSSTAAVNSHCYFIS
jgi:hypothetical protein